MNEEKKTRKHLKNSKLYYIFFTVTIPFFLGCILYFWQVSVSNSAIYGIRVGGPQIGITAAIGYSFIMGYKFYHERFYLLIIAFFTHFFMFSIFYIPFYHLWGLTMGLVDLFLLFLESITLGTLILIIPVIMGYFCGKREIFQKLHSKLKKNKLPIRKTKQNTISYTIDDRREQSDTSLDF